MSVKPIISKFISSKKNQKVRTTSSQRITLILPACNQEMSIGSLVLLSKLYVNNVIVIDDGSIDRTADIARKAGAEVIVQGAKKRKSEVLKSGFVAAADAGTDIIVTMDSDGQHNPTDIPLIVAPIIEGNAEMVNGSRYLNGFGKNTSIYRHADHILQKNSAQMSQGFNITDPLSGFRAFSTSKINVFNFNAQDTVIESEMLSDAKKAGLIIKEVEIGALNDSEAQSMNPVKYIHSLVKSVAEDIEANTSLYYNSVPGFALATCGFYMAFKFIEDLFGGIQSLSYGPTFLMIFLAFFGIYLTLRGIVMHSVVEVIRQTEPVR